jgi:nucleoside-diphosphate-sugar epimerase
MMRILLTGASGFLGSRIARALLARGHQVVATRRRETRFAQVQGDASAIAWIDASQAAEAFPVDAVVHAACDYGRNQPDAAAVLEANRDFPLRILASAAATGTRCFINIGTSLPAGVSPYASAKNQFLVQASRMPRAQTALITLAAEQFYGPGDDERKFIAWLIGNCLRGVDPIPLTQGEQLRDIIHVDDVVAAVLVALAASWGEGATVTLPVGTGVGTSIRALAESIARLCGYRGTLGFGMVPYRTAEPMRSIADPSAMAALGWKAGIPLDEGLAAVVAAAQATRSALPGGVR